MVDKPVIDRARRILHAVRPATSDAEAQP
jgi:hypothetical protein